MVDYIIDCLCCLCFRCSKFEFIEPESIECYEEYDPEYDPDYIPIYVDITGTEHSHKYANMAP